MADKKREEYLKQYIRQYYRDHKEKCKDRNRIYYLNNKEKIKEYRREQYQTEKLLRLCPYGGWKADQYSIEICSKCPEPDCILPDIEL